MKKKYVKDYIADETVEGGYRYTGVYYTDNFEKDIRIKNGLIHLIVGVLQIVFILFTASINCMGNRTIYVVIPMECTLFCALNLCLGAYTFLKSSNRMELHQYEGSYLKMVQAVTVAFFLNVGSIIGQIVVIAKGVYEFGVLNEVLLLVALILMGAVNAMEWMWHRKMISLVAKEES
ncbi:MAG: hypothetical protein IJD24_00010 [Agathobacter sp.]|nr:hypothetical protein [Agathobacter sp.]